MNWRSNNNTCTNILQLFCCMHRSYNSETWPLPFQFGQFKTPWAPFILNMTLQLRLNSPRYLLAIITTIQNRGEMSFHVLFHSLPYTPEAFVLAQSPVLPDSSLLLWFHCLPEGRWPRVCWLYLQPCIVLRGGFRLSKHLLAAAFTANTQSGISSFLSLRH